jgi:acylpyruvate hydrolase
MRLVSYSADGGWRSGIEVGDRIADGQRAATAAGFAADEAATLSSTRAVVALDPGRLRALAEAASSADGLIDRDGVRIGPPVWDPQKIVCLGLNYRDHAKESGLTAPSAPMFFAKFANSLIGPADEIRPPRSTEKVDYEAELAVVIGQRGRNISAGDALGHVAGAMALNDVSARDLQLANNLWTGGKAVDTFAPCGPALVTIDEIDDLQDLGVRTRVNGETVQDGTTASMIFGVADTIAFLSQIMTLEPGDIIATGTPAGVGQSRDPQLFLASGDVVEVEIDTIGTLRNPVGPAV